MHSVTFGIYLGSHHFLCSLLKKILLCVSEFLLTLLYSCGTSRPKLKMAPFLEWKKLMKVDPDALPHQEELADNLLETVAKVCCLI